MNTDDSLDAAGPEPLGPRAALAAYFPMRAMSTANSWLVYGGAAFMAAYIVAQGAFQNIDWRLGYWGIILWVVGIFRDIRARRDLSFSGRLVLLALPMAILIMAAVVLAYQILARKAP
ncbi:MAG: hypothetical protein QOF67_1665 [Mycobacterium sp.]|nr:hypothetical protein [Mycobacterium sp.]